MQQAASLSTLTHSGRSAGTTGTAPRIGGLMRQISRRWDLAGVVALMGSCAAYAVFALMPLGH